MSISFCITAEILTNRISFNNNNKKPGLLIFKLENNLKKTEFQCKKKQPTEGASAATNNFSYEPLKLNFRPVTPTRGATGMAKWRREGMETTSY